MRSGSLNFELFNNGGLAGMLTEGWLAFRGGQETRQVSNASVEPPLAILQPAAGVNRMKTAAKKKKRNRRDALDAMRDEVEEINPASAQARENWLAKIENKFDDVSAILEENRMPARKQVELIYKLTGMVGSEKRLQLFLDIASNIILPETFWPAFHEVWTECDDTWPLRDDLYRALSRFRYRCPCDSLLKENADFFKSLPTSISIYRGCSRSRIRGFSWTTDPQVAIGFSKGHRCIEVPDPVVCSATIRKCDVFSASVDRKEQELVIDYRKLRDLKVVPLEKVKR